MLGKFLYDVVEFGFRLCYLGVSEGRLCMKEPQVGVLCPEIRELDEDFGDELGWSFFPVGHDARMYHLMFEVQENHETG